MRRAFVIDFEGEFYCCIYFTISHRARLHPVTRTLTFAFIVAVLILLLGKTKHLWRCVTLTFYSVPGCLLWTVQKNASFLLAFVPQDIIISNTLLCLSLVKRLYPLASSPSSSHFWRNISTVWWEAIKHYWDMLSLLTLIILYKKECYNALIFLRHWKWKYKLMFLLTLWCLFCDLTNKTHAFSCLLLAKIISAICRSDRISNYFLFYIKII